MVRRTKRLKKGIESIKKEIEEHFKKLEKQIKENKTELGRYHTKELEKSLIRSLEAKMKLLNVRDDSLNKFKKRLERIKEEL